MSAPTLMAAKRIATLKLPAHLRRILRAELRGEYAVTLAEFMAGATDQQIMDWAHDIYDGRKYYRDNYSIHEKGDGEWEPKPKPGR